MTGPAGLTFDAADAAPPRDAATVLVLRSGPRGAEVFCVRRHGAVAFLGGAVVFPGGKVDEADRTFSGAVGSEPAARGLSLTEAQGAAATAELRALCVAAAREALEEAAILPACRAGGGPLGAAELLSAREELERGTPLAEVLAARGAALDLGALVPFARWITPEAERRRFDARFFLLPLPAGQVGRHDDRETTSGLWDTPRGILARFESGEIQLAPPTTRSLELLQDATSIDDAVRVAAEQALSPVCPRFVPADPPFLALPGDPAHPIAERRVAGPTRFVLADGRFVSADPPPG